MFQAFLDAMSDPKVSNMIADSLLNKTLKLKLLDILPDWTNNEFLNRLKETAKDWNVNYVRLLTDCNLGRTEQLKSHNNLSEKLQSMNLISTNGENKEKFFHQLKFHGTKEEANILWDEGKCFLQTYNVFWDTTGPVSYTHLTLPTKA